MATIEIDGVKYVGANSFAQGDLSRPHKRNPGETDGYYRN
jgi:hypothetical protein